MMGPFIFSYTFTKFLLIMSPVQPLQTLTYLKHLVSEWNKHYINFHMI